MEDYKANVGCEREEKSDPNQAHNTPEKSKFKVKNNIKPSTFYEIYAHYFFMRPISMAVNVICAIYLAFSLYYIAYSFALLGTFEIEMVICVVAFATITAVRIWQYKSSSKTAYRRMCEINIPLEYFILVGDRKIWREGEFDRGIEMCAIRVAYVTKNYIYLITSAKQMMFFERNGFVEGNDSDLLKFLAGMGVRTSKIKH